MMTNDLLQLGLALAAGAALGAVFFGGLWVTLQFLPTARWPVLLVFGSLLMRMAVTLIGFYVVMAGDWQRLLICMVGFILMRQLMIRWLRPAQTKLLSLHRG